MSEPHDKELEEEGGLSVVENRPLPFEKPEKFIHIPENVIQDVSRYMVTVIGTATSNREVNVKNILNNAKNMFRDGVRYHDDLWMEHCASSIREILSFVAPEHFNQTFQSIPQPTDPSVDRVFKFLINANSYLSSIVHLRPASRISDAEGLYPGQGYGQKDQKEFLDTENNFFERVCIDVVYTLHFIFINYCAGNKTGNKNGSN